MSTPLNDKAYAQRKAQAQESRERAEVLRDWTPEQHVDRACDLLAIYDVTWDDEGVWVGSGGAMSTPPCLTAAQAHIDIANAKRAEGVSLNRIAVALDDE